MIQSLKVKNFKNFDEEIFQFSPHITVVYGNNGKGKSSLLEAISYLGNIDTKTKAEVLVKNTESSFFVQMTDSENEYKGSYEQEKKKKHFFINNKKTSSKKFFEQTSKFCYFEPAHMNLFILGPSGRRDFINNIISNCFPGYDSILKHYNKILKSRNAVLSAISEKKAQENELDYWDDSFCEAATEVYRYRYLFVEFFSSHTNLLKKCIGEKYSEITFEYISKVDFKNPREIIKDYLTDNRQRDLIIGKTHIGPHRDDFTIYVQNSAIGDFASRGETKSIILGLKFIESAFIQKHTDKKTTFLIDDFNSELDPDHQEKLLNILSDHQIILTNIDKLTPKNIEAEYIELI